MHIDLPLIFAICAFILLMYLIFGPEKDYGAKPITNHGQIKHILRHECPMLEHFVSAHTLARKYNLDSEALEYAINDFVLYGILERRHRRQGRLMNVELYRRRSLTIAESPPEI